MAVEGDEEAGRDLSDAAIDLAANSDGPREAPVETWIGEVPETGDAAVAGDALDAGSDQARDVLPNDDLKELDGGHPDADSGSPPPCDLSKPYGNITLVRGLESPAGKATNMATFSADELTAYFASDRGGPSSIFTATRYARTDAFLTPTFIPLINRADTYSAGPAVTADGLTMYFETFRTATVTVQVSKRTALDAPWSLPVLAPGISVDGAVTDGGPYLSPNGKVIYYHSSRVTGTSLHVLRAEMQADGFGTPVLASVLALPGWDAEPVASSDDLTLFFGSSRTSDGSKGGWDIWSSHRDSIADPFPPPINVEELNTEGDDIPSWLSPDSCRLYFERRGPGLLYVASKPDLDSRYDAAAH